MEANCLRLQRVVCNHTLGHWSRSAVQGCRRYSHESERTKLIHAGVTIGFVSFLLHPVDFYHLEHAELLGYRLKAGSSFVPPSFSSRVRDFPVPEARRILTLSVFFPEPSAIPCNVDVPCHFPNMGRPGRAARRWTHNNVRPQRSDRPHAVFLSPSLILSVLLQHGLFLPHTDIHSLGHRCTKLQTSKPTQHT